MRRGPQAVAPDLEALRQRIRTLAKELRDARREFRRLDGAAKRRHVPRKIVSDGLGRWKQDRDECDKLMARIVKVEVDRCESCNSRDREAFQWAHGFTRGYYSIRWDRENSFCLCSACHKRYTHDPIGWEAFMVAKLGRDRYDGMHLRAQLKVRFDPRLLIGLRFRAEQLGVHTDEGWRAWRERAS